jgi:HK97 family phage major capsid protein
MALTRIQDVTSTSQFIPAEIASGIIKDVRHTSAVMARAKKVPMRTLTRTYNRRVSGPGAYWVADLQRKTADKAAWDQITMNAHELAVIVPVKERDFIGNPLDVWAEIREDIVEAFAIAFDSAALFGSTSPYTTSFMDAVVASNNYVAEGTGVDLGDDLNLAMGVLEGKNYDPNGFVSLRSLKPRLRGLRSDDNTPIIKTNMTQDAANAIHGQPVSFYKDSASWGANITALVADWDTVHFGVPEGISYKLLTEATLTTVTDVNGDPLALAELDMVALRATAFFGFLPTKQDACAALVEADYSATA